MVPLGCGRAEAGGGRPRPARHARTGARRSLEHPPHPSRGQARTARAGQPPTHEDGSPPVSSRAVRRVGCLQRRNALPRRELLRSAPSLPTRSDAPGLQTGTWPRSSPPAGGPSGAGVLPAYCVRPRATRQPENGVVSVPPRMKFAPSRVNPNVAGRRHPPSLRPFRESHLPNSNHVSNPSGQPRAIQNLV